MKEEKQETILIGIKEATKIIGIGRNTLLQLVKIKNFPVIFTEGKYYIIRDELKGWFSKNRGINIK